MYYECQNCGISFRSKISKQCPDCGALDTITKDDDEDEQLHDRSDEPFDP